MAKQVINLKTTYTPDIGNSGDVSQNIKIALSGQNKNGKTIILKGEIDLFQASQLIKGLKDAVRKHHECVIANVNMFNDQLKIG